MSTPLSSRGCHTPPQPRGQLVGSGKNSSPANFPSTWLPSSREPREEKHGRAVFVFKEGFKAILVDTLSLAAVKGSRPFWAFQNLPIPWEKVHEDTPLQMFIQMFIRYFRVGGKTTSSGICQFSVTATLERMCAAGCQMAVRYMPAGTPSISTVDSFVDIFFELFQTSNRNSN